MMARTLSLRHFTSEAGVSKCRVALANWNPRWVSNEDVRIAAVPEAAPD